MFYILFFLLKSKKETLLWMLLSWINWWISKSTFKCPKQWFE